jgi:hypothetical protein
MDSECIKSYLQIRLANLFYFIYISTNHSESCKLLTSEIYKFCGHIISTNHRESCKLLTTEIQGRLTFWDGGVCYKMHANMASSID